MSMNDFHGQKGGSGNWILWMIALAIPAFIFCGALGLVADIAYFGYKAYQSDQMFKEAQGLVIPKWARDLGIAHTVSLEEFERTYGFDKLTWLPQDEIDSLAREDNILRNKTLHNMYGDFYQVCNEAGYILPRPRIDYETGKYYRVFRNPDNKEERVRIDYPFRAQQWEIESEWKMTEEKYDKRDSNLWEAWNGQASKRRY